MSEEIRHDSTSMMRALADDERAAEIAEQLLRTRIRELEIQNAKLEAMLDKWGERLHLAIQARKLAESQLKESSS